MTPIKPLLTFAMCFLTLGACSVRYEVNWYNDSDLTPVSITRAAEIDTALQAIVNKHQINTAGMGIIKEGQLVWQGYYGEQSPGVAASDQTLFNVASITKTVTAETILRLVEQGEIDLDESMSKYWVDPDLKDDPRHQLLTPRMALNHTTGFLNWRFFSADRKLKFVNEPGTTFGYSGEGFEYVAKFAAAKMGKSFETLVEETIFTPLSMRDTAISVQKANHNRIAKPLAADGTFYGYYCRPEGWSAPEGYVSVADDMVTTVPDYAKFLISAMQGEGLSRQLSKQRQHIAMDEVSDQGADCSHFPAAECPESEGYGLGWYVVEPNGNQMIGHGGSDWSEISQAYFYSGSRDGVIIFLNAPSKQAIKGMIEALKVIDPKSAKLHEYNRWLMSVKK